MAALLRELQAARAPIHVVGGGTKLCAPDGGALRGAALSTRRLRRVVEYAPQDLYLRVEAGATLAEVQALAARDGLWWPVAHPWPEATVGGVVASSWNGPSRWRYGALRDLVLGGVVVLPDGRPGRVGGKVVKNVAGYDMTKLHVGALGTLGVLTEVNLKLAALPATRRTLAATASSVQQGVAAALAAFRTNLVASSVLVFGGDRAGLGLPDEGAATVVVEAAGHAADVEQELRIAARALAGLDTAGATEQAGDAAGSEWQRAGVAASGVIFRVGLPHALLGEVLSHPALRGAAFVAVVTWLAER